MGCIMNDVKVLKATIPNSKEEPLGYTIHDCTKGDLFSLSLSSTSEMNSPEKWFAFKKLLIICV